MINKFEVWNSTSVTGEETNPCSNDSLAVEQTFFLKQKTNPTNIVSCRGRSKKISWWKPSTGAISSQSEADREWAFSRVGPQLWNSLSCLAPWLHIFQRCIEGNANRGRLLMLPPGLFIYFYPQLFYYFKKPPALILINSCFFRSFFLCCIMCTLFALIFYKCSVSYPESGNNSSWKVGCIL